MVKRVHSIKVMPFSYSSGSVGRSKKKHVAAVNHLGDIVNAYFGNALHLNGAARLNKYKGDDRSKARKRNPLRTNHDHHVLDVHGRTSTGKQRFKRKATVASSALSTQFDLALVDDISALPPFFSYLHNTFADPANVGNQFFLDISPPSFQGRCGSCWAASAAEVLSDVHVRAHQTSAGNYNNPRLSKLNTLACKTGGGGCSGGDVLDAFEHYQRHGVVDSTCANYDNWCSGSLCGGDGNSGGGGASEFRTDDEIIAQLNQTLPGCNQCTTATTSRSTTSFATPPPLHFAHSIEFLAMDDLSIRPSSLTKARHDLVADDFSEKFVDPQGNQNYHARTVGGVPQRLTLNSPLQQQNFVKANRHLVLVDGSYYDHYGQPVYEADLNLSGVAVPLSYLSPAKELRRWVDLFCDTVKAHILHIGPVVGCMHIYNNFVHGDLMYTGGVYIDCVRYPYHPSSSQTSSPNPLADDEYVGSHAVAIIGWGVDTIPIPKSNASIVLKPTCKDLPDTYPNCSLSDYQKQVNRNWASPLPYLIPPPCQTDWWQTDTKPPCSPQVHSDDPNRELKALVQDNFDYIQVPYWICRNSWGTEWGGYSGVPYIQSWEVDGVGHMTAWDYVYWDEENRIDMGYFKMAMYNPDQPIMPVTSFDPTLAPNPSLQYINHVVCFERQTLVQSPEGIDPTGGIIAIRADHDPHCVSPPTTTNQTTSSSVSTSTTTTSTSITDRQAKGKKGLKKATATITPSTSSSTVVSSTQPTTVTVCSSADATSTTICRPDNNPSSSSLDSSTTRPSNSKLDMKHYSDLKRIVDNQDTASSRFSNLVQLLLSVALIVLSLGLLFYFMVHRGSAKTP